MKKQLDHYKISIERSVVDLAWAHWIRLGVYGRGQGQSCNADIEAAVYLLACAGWLDARLLEAALSWMERYEGAINPERMKLLLKSEADPFILRSVGALIESSSSLTNPLRWRSLFGWLTKRLGKMKRKPVGNSLSFYFSLKYQKKKDAFFSKWGLSHDSIVLTGKLDRHETILQKNALIFLRYLIGTSARPDVVYLLSADRANGRGLTIPFLVSITGYHASSVFRIMSDLSLSGAVEPGGASGARNVPWRLASRIPFGDGLQKERGIINWRIVIPIVVNVLRIVHDLKDDPKDLIQKHEVASYLGDALPQLKEAGIAGLPSSKMAPLALVSIEDMLRVADDSLKQINSQCLN